CADACRIGRRKRTAERLLHWRSAIGRERIGGSGRCSWRWRLGWLVGTERRSALMLHDSARERVAIKLREWRGRCGAECARQASDVRRRVVLGGRRVLRHEAADRMPAPSVQAELIEQRLIAGLW